MAKKKSNLVLNTVVLAVISIISVALLAIVNQITAGPINEAEVNKKAEVYKSIYTCENYAEIENLDELIANSQALLEEKGFSGCAVVDAMACKDASGNIEGYVIAASSNAGYGGEIKVAIGIKDGKLTGFSALSHSETAGLGAKCTEPEFADQFKDKAASILSYSKTGASGDTEIDAISGATITTNAVTQAVNSAILFYQENFGGGAQEIAAADYTEFYNQLVDGATFDDIEGAKDMIASSQDLFSQYGIEGAAIEDVKAVNGGDGYVICASGTGFAKTSPFKYAVYIKDNAFQGFVVVDTMETPGYGAQMTEDKFTSQFKGKPVGIMTSKVGATAENEIDAISGATITTNGVTSSINGVVLFYQQNLGDGVTVDTSDMPVVDAVAGATE